MHFYGTSFKDIHFFTIFLFQNKKKSNFNQKKKEVVNKKKDGEHFWKGLEGIVDQRPTYAEVFPSEFFFPLQRVVP